jgi:hypothetical protein
MKSWAPPLVGFPAQKVKSGIDFSVSVFLNGLVAIVVLENVRPESGDLLRLALIAGVAHEDVVAIEERFGKLA